MGDPSGPESVFLSTPSARRATQTDPRYQGIYWHFYPRPPRGGRPLPLRFRYTQSYFYPRPPRGGRPAPLPAMLLAEFISIHALREEGDFPQRCTCDRAKAFLSTPSARRATAASLGDVGIDSDFYPRPPRGGRRFSQCLCSAFYSFLSTPSARRATDGTKLDFDSVCISIHALREEGDSKNGEKHLRFCFIIKRSAQIWKSFSKNIRKNSCNLHRTA